MYKTPRVDDSSTQRALEEVLKAINDLSNRVPQDSGTVGATPQSTPIGAISIEKTDTGHQLLVNTNEGLAKTTITLKEGEV